MSAAPNINQPEYESDFLIPPKINHEFSKNEMLDDTKVYRRLGHAMNDTIKKWQN